MRHDAACRRRDGELKRGTCMGNTCMPKALDHNMSPQAHGASLAFLPGRDKSSSRGHPKGCHPTLSRVSLAQARSQRQPKTPTTLPCARIWAESNANNRQGRRLRSRGRGVVALACMATCGANNVAGSNAAFPVATSLRGLCLADRSALCMRGRGRNRSRSPGRLEGLRPKNAGPKTPAKGHRSCGIPW